MRVAAPRYAPRRHGADPVRQPAGVRVPRGFVQHGRYPRHGIAEGPDGIAEGLDDVKKKV